MEGNTGKLIITNFRIASNFPRLGMSYQMPHDMITSFKWDSGFRKGNNFKITWFENQQSIQVHYKTKNKKKMSKLLEKMSYYDQPAVLKIWHSETQDEYNMKSQIPENILKIRYANGDITKEEYEEMVNVLR
ncbi:MAG: SHOCT domain-containing protein [Nitrosopumilus sp.]|nr:SHOCT domain-containing protein [Nitrosopumilus sp.]MCE2507331.1 SHOCT domain-containing protein [Nitrosopumilaceae archaeon]